MYRKQVETVLKSANASERTVTGIAAVHGNIDAGGDRSHPGAFARAVRDPSRVKYLWQHEKDQPPIAKVVRIRELGRSELPSEVLRKAPEATGGLEVTRKYLTHPTAEAAYQGVLSGALSEMSYAYEVLRDGYTTEKSRRVRELYEVEIWEASDVTWGMNAATVSMIAAKMRAGRSANRFDAELDALLTDLERVARPLAQGLKQNPNQLALAEIRRKLTSGVYDDGHRGYIARLREVARKNGVKV